MFCLCIGRYDATAGLRALDFNRPAPSCSHYKCLYLQWRVSSPILCIIIVLDVLVFTVKRFQQTKHRKISVFVKCMLFTDKSAFSSFARKRETPYIQWED